MERSPHIIPGEISDALHLLYETELYASELTKTESGNLSYWYGDRERITVAIEGKASTIAVDGLRIREEVSKILSQCGFEGKIQFRINNEDEKDKNENILPITTKIEAA